MFSVAWCTLIFLSVVIHPIRGGDPLNDVFVVHGIKIVKDKEKLIVKMPYRNSKTGREDEIVKPKTRHFRKYINQAILEAYQKEISA